MRTVSLREIIFRELYCCFFIVFRAVWVSAQRIAVPDGYALSVSTNARGRANSLPLFSASAFKFLVVFINNTLSEWGVSGWIGVLSGLAIPANLTINRNKSVSANFEVNGADGRNNTVAISKPFSQNGVSEYYWQTSDNISFVNSRNLEKLHIKSVDLTNTWAGNMPSKQECYYNIHSVGDCVWLHFEADSTKNIGSLTVINSAIDVHCYPNLLGNQLNNQFRKELNETIDIYLLNTPGNFVPTCKTIGQNRNSDMSGLSGGYTS